MRFKKNYFENINLWPFCYKERGRYFVEMDLKNISQSAFILYYTRTHLCVKCLINIDKSRFRCMCIFCIYELYNKTIKLKIQYTHTHTHTYSKRNNLFNV